MALNGGRPSKPRAWLLAARPKTLPAAVAPVLVGSALAHAQGAFAPGPALVALLVALLLQIAVNLANDYFDHAHGVDTEARQGPARAVQGGWISPGELKAGLGAVLGLAAIAGGYLAAVAGWPVLVIGALAMLCTLAYSAGPFPLASRGLGDVFVFLFFGLVAVGGTYYVQARALSSWTLQAAVPVGALITAILVVNNLRDIPTDRAAGKFTLAVMLGPRRTRLEYAALIALAYAMPPLLWLEGWSGWIWLPWLSLPLAAWLVRRVHGASGRALNAVLAQTAQLALAYGVLFALGLILN